MTAKLLSVLISSYNGEKHLRQCLDSVFGSLSKENDNDVEFVVINDGSTDSTQEILESYRKQYDLRLINQQNMGVSKTRNKLISLAEGKFIYQIDHDDYLLPNALDKIVCYLKKHDDIDMLVFDYCKFENGNAPHLFFKGGLDAHCYMNGQTAFVKMKAQHIYNVPFWTRVVRKACMTDNGIFYNEEVSREDIECAPRIFAVAQKVAYLPETIYAYRRDSATSQDTRNRRNKNYAKLQLLIVTSLLEFMKRDDLSAEYRKTLLEVIGDLYWDVLDGIKYDGKFNDEVIALWEKQSWLMKYGKFDRRVFYRILVKILGVRKFYEFRYSK